VTTHTRRLADVPFVNLLAELRSRLEHTRQAETSSSDSLRGAAYALIEAAARRGAT